MVAFTVCKDHVSLQTSLHNYKLLSTLIVLFSISTSVRFITIVKVLPLPEDTHFHGIHFVYYKNCTNINILILEILPQEGPLISLVHVCNCIHFSNSLMYWFIQKINPIIIFWNNIIIFITPTYIFKFLWSIFVIARLISLLSLLYSLGDNKSRLSPKHPHLICLKLGN